MLTLSRTFEDDYHSFRKRAANVIDAIEALGVTVPPGSRFRRYISELNSVVERGMWRRSIDQSLFHQANLEFEDLEFIMGAGQACTIVDVERHLEQIVSGHASPQDERRHSRSRDLQFELVIASTLRSHGIPVRLDEPDVVFKIDGREYGIAAKRPRSPQKLGKNLRAAEKQIASAHLEGLIALDLGCLLNPQNAFLRVNRFAEAQEHVSNWLNSFLFTNKDRIADETQPSAALGVFAHVTMMVVEQSRSRLGTVRHSVLMPFHCTCGETPLKRIFALLSRSQVMSSCSKGAAESAG